MSRWFWRLALGAALALLAGCAGQEPAPGPSVDADAATTGMSPSVPDGVVQRALEGTPSGEALSWRVAGTEERGTVTPVRTFRTASGFCREYHVTLSVGDGTGHAWRDVACRDEAGVWQPVGA